ncbi:MAG: Ribonuclease 3 [Alphaproteobacteria bacterium MarineAlpha3_Bin1]|nr:MAG: Ribonuclease 3 [Alphaproteobacteria bacterium MarineAlpha3_Bin1]
MSRKDNHQDSDTPVPDLARLQAALGHQFKNLQLLTQALTHASAAKDRLKSNERLEFLGDRVLGLVIAELLLETFPEEDEGKVGYRFSALARRESLARVAEDIDLAQHIDSAKGNDGTSRRNNPSILADCCEAVIAAIYLDAGLDAAKVFIVSHWRALMIETPAPPKDSKTTLQEWDQGEGHALPYYQETTRNGPAHAPRFTIEVTVGPKKPVSGQGASKQAAEQAAAAAMLESIGVSE